MNRTLPFLLTEVRALQPKRVTLDDVRRAARVSGQVQVIGHADDASRVVIVTPGGAVMGTTNPPLGWVEGEALAARIGDYYLRMEEAIAMVGGLS